MKEEEKDDNFHYSNFQKRTEIDTGKRIIMLQ